MFIRDLLDEIYNGLVSNKARSGLTILGIVIGIASVIVMVAVGQGSQESVEEQIQSIGSNLLTIQPGQQGGVGFSARQGMGSAESLTLEDAEAIYDEIATVEAVAPVISGSYQIIASNGNNTNTSVYGVTESYPDVNNIELDQGSLITENQINSLRKVAVIGSGVIEDLFETSETVVGQSIKINQIDFTIIGTLEEKGGSGMGSTDDLILIPIDTAQQYLSGSDSLSTVSVKVSSNELMDLTETLIENLLLTRHGIDDADDADFRIMNQADILETATSVTGTLTILLGVVAGISLVVGGIGIMNMMLTTVTERTKEIGLRKAIGATRANINLQFFCEAVALTVIGGTIGILMGVSIAYIVEHYFDLATSVSTSSVVLAFGVSALIGVVFGYYPAQKASKLSPITALRYQ
jgi:putative ABC transport system permease protein